MSVKIRPLFELIPYVITILIQRIIFFENNRFLFQFNHQGGEIYNHLFPLISTGFLFAAANISAINTSVRSENAKKNSIIYRCVIFNILYLFLLGILLFLLSNKLQSFLDLKTINYNQFLEFILFSLSNFSGIVLFSCVEGFLILTKRTKILSVILIFMIFIHAAALRIFPVFLV